MEIGILVHKTSDEVEGMVFVTTGINDDSHLDNYDRNQSPMPARSVISKLICDI